MDDTLPQPARLQPNVGILVEERKDCLILSWDNRKVRKDRVMGCFFALFWIIWTPATLFMTIAAFFARGSDLAFVMIWLTFGWLGVIAIPYLFVQRTWRESIVLDASAITLTFTGFLAKKPRTMPLGAIKEILIGRVGDESVVTLNINLTTNAAFWHRRQMIGYWFSPAVKDQLFQAIEVFVEMHHLDVRMIRLL